MWDAIKENVSKAWKDFRASDPDDLFAYETPKVVVIRDRYLGLTHYLLMFTIFIYIFGVVLMSEKGYMLYVPPLAVFRTDLGRLIS
jgi:hypothetical protein